MTSTLSNPYADPLATLHDLGLVTTLLGETMFSPEGDDMPVSDRSRHARTFFAAQVGILTTKLSKHLRSPDADHDRGSRELFLYDDHPTDILLDLVSVLSVLSDYARHPHRDHFFAEVHDGAAIMLDWIADSLSEMETTGVRYLSDSEKAKIDTETAAMAARLSSAKTKSEGGEKMEKAAWDTLEKEAS